MSKKNVYVCLSECKEVVKVGITYNISTRVPSLRTDNGGSLKAVFCSKEIDTNRAKEIEQKVSSKFKDNIIKGKEWYNIRPITIIEYLINELGLEPYEFSEIETGFQSWKENASEYKSYLPSIEIPAIKEKRSKGLYSIRYVDGDEFKYIGFCNYGDAKKFYYSNKIFVLMADNIVEDLYGIPIVTLQTLQISSKKSIYKLKDQILEIKERLQRLLELTNI